MRQRELTKVATSERSLVVAAGILLTTLGIGALIGWMGMGMLWSQGGFAPREAVNLICSKHIYEKKVSTFYTNHQGMLKDLL